MSKIAINSIIYLAIFAFTSGCAFAQAFSGHVDEMKRAIESSYSISMYFYTSTDLHVQRGRTNAREPTATLTIKCGFACGHVMRKIVNNFAHSVMMPNCPRENTFLVIRFDNAKALSYFHGGEISKYRGRCYYNKESINDVIHVLDFF